MWVSSLKANPRFDEPDFIAIVLGSLHNQMCVEHDDEVLLDGQGNDDENSQEMNPKRGEANPIKEENR